MYFIFISRAFSRILAHSVAVSSEWWNRFFFIGMVCTTEGAWLLSFGGRAVRVWKRFGWMDGVEGLKCCMVRCTV